MFEILYNIFLALVACLLLWKSADWLVDAASEIAKIFGLSELVIGLTIVAFGTSAPEFIVSLYSALNGESVIAMSNVIGSNIFNLGLILGFSAVVHPFIVEKGLVYRDTSLLFVSLSLLYIFIFYIHFDQSYTLSRFEGLGLFSILIIYILFLIKSRKKRKALNQQQKNQEIDWHKLSKFIGVILLSIVIMFFGGKLLINSAQFFVEYFQLPESLVGETIVAFGTSVPEVITSIVSLIKKSRDIALGNLIGSDLFNVLGVLGLTATINNGIAIHPAYQLNILLAILMIVVLFIFMRTTWKINRIHGCLLMLFGIMRWGINIV